MDFTTDSPGAPFSTMKHDMPRWRGCAWGSVTARSANVFPSRPLVTNIFVPLIRKVSPRATARVRMACTSEPAWGSVRQRPPRASPLAKRGSSRRRCASVPWCSTMSAAMVWLLTTPASDIQPRQSSSMTRAYVVTSRPSPPYSRGTSAPKRPSARIASTRAYG
jgi:hypothetical protein